MRNLKLDAVATILLLFPTIWYNTTLEDMLDKQKQQTEDLVTEMNSKKNFLRKVCHELRTPFTSVLGYMELLQDCEGVQKDYKAKDYVGNSIQSCIHLVSMLNSVLSK